ncbi:hypothetical protein [Rhodococcus kronopolitis]|uniref:Secreted protein n=1 Tax=Rhodococcus kronopolitis TaxID=1460226 RepID=A0ABV9FN62_9NOCA
MSRRLAAGVMVVTAGILLAPAVGIASAEVSGPGQVVCGSGETKTENGLSCSTDVNGEVGNGSSIVGLDLADFTALFESLTG